MSIAGAALATGVGSLHRLGREEAIMLPLCRGAWWRCGQQACAHSRDHMQEMASTWRAELRLKSVAGVVISLCRSYNFAADVIYR